MDQNSSAAPESAAKKKKHLPLIITLAAVVTVLAALYIFRHGIINLLTKPTLEPDANEVVHSTVKDTSESDPPETEPDTHTEDIYNLLICGHDRVADNTDVNLLISFNTTKMTASVMQIPRDVNATFAPYTDGYIRPIVNGIFGICKDADSSDEYIQRRMDKYERGSDLRGIAGFAAYLERNLCVKIHYFGVMDLSQFANIVDALGGVEMDVPYDLKYDDGDQNLHIDVKQGRQILDGATAEQIVRFRSGYANADLGRGNVQKMFMASLVKTVQSKTNIFNAGKIAKVCGIIADNLVTNMTTSDLIYFANNAMTLDMRYVTFMTMPIGGYFDEAKGTWYSCLNKEGTLKYINNYFNVYKNPVAPEEFDSNGVFYLDSYWYWGPSANITEYIYTGAEMTEEGFKPVVGY